MAPMNMSYKLFLGNIRKPQLTVSSCGPGLCWHQHPSQLSHRCLLQQPSHQLSMPLFHTLWLCTGSGPSFCTSTDLYSFLAYSFLAWI